MVAGATDEGLCLLEFADRRMLENADQTVRAATETAARAWRAPTSDSDRRRVASLLRRHAARLHGAPGVPGTPFEERVWRQLLEIPYGETCSYADLAGRVNAPGAQRAVGRANGMNRIAIVIPCHRVVNSDGKLGGYGGGLWRKHWLLSLESGRGHHV